jgi:hypothetical protein
VGTFTAAQQQRQQRDRAELVRQAQQRTRSAPRARHAPPSAPAPGRSASLDSAAPRQQPGARGGRRAAAGSDATLAEAGEEVSGRKAAGHWGRKIRSALGELLGKLQEQPCQRGTPAGGTARH